MIKKTLHAIAWRAERLLDRIKGQRDPRRIIEPYIGYANPDHIVVRGRVLTALRRNAPTPTQSWWVNFKQMFSLFLTDEVANVTVQSGKINAISDDEGYFSLLLPRDRQSGWVDIPVTIAGQTGQTLCPVLVPGGTARFGIISDIDDTVLKTGAYSLIRNLWNSLTGNALTRRIFPDAVTCLQSLSEEGRNPVYYVSSSPWTLHHFLDRIFHLADLVKGPKFLRDLGLSQTQFVTGTHGDHKGGAIDVLMAANPQLGYVLMGDTGQHDAMVYRDAVLRHPGRVMAVVLRKPGPGPDAQSRAAMDEIRGAGVPVFSAVDFAGVAPSIDAIAAQD
ncbi:phosphatase domain-containing protein [Sulfitobacter mediterraneus]|uniref:phosphatase domain-containing protein n=1 Tax=Sulfitobacter mediterraneus TaxID=83219 RepID=UPI000EA3D5F3|nr:phosphatase domain-containing protein [Sulfitobacter mediterraneus]